MMTLKGDGRAHIGRGRRQGVRPQTITITPSSTGKINGTDKDKPRRNRGEQPRWQQDGGGKFR